MRPGRRPEPARSFRSVDDDPGVRVVERAVPVAVEVDNQLDCGRRHLDPVALAAAEVHDRVVPVPEAEDEDVRSAGEDEVVDPLARPPPSPQSRSSPAPPTSLSTPPVIVAVAASPRARCRLRR